MDQQEVNPSSESGLKTGFLFGEMPRPTAEPKMHVAGMDPDPWLSTACCCHQHDISMPGSVPRYAQISKVHYPDQEGCYAGIKWAALPEKQVRA